MSTSNWIDDLVNENQHVETPVSWLWWSLLSAISASAGNNYYVSTLRGDVIYKPNLYIILLGESGLGKGYPISLAKRLVQSAEVTRVIAGRSSIQGIVQEMSSSKTMPGKQPITDSRCYITNGELSTAIIADPDALTILTDLFDGNYNTEWENMLKMGKEKLKNPYVTCLFGSSPAHFYDSIPQVNIEGGYIGRNLIIYEEKRSKDTDLLDVEDDKSALAENKFDSYIVPKYVPHLTKIASQKGRLIPSTEARELFNTWRKQWRNKQQVDRTGFMNRVPDHVMKVAICLSLADYDFNGIIGEFHIHDAIDRITALIYANKKTTEYRGPDPLAEASRRVLDILLGAEENKMSRKIMGSKGVGYFDFPTLDRIIENLLELGWIRREKIVAGKNTDWILHLSGEPLINYQKYLAGLKR